MNNNDHLAQFQGDCSVLTTESSYRRHFRGQEFIGRNPDANDPRGSMFVSSKADIDNAIASSNGDLSKLEKSLGLPEGQFRDSSLVRVDIHNPENHGLRVSNGKEAGANEFWNTPLDKDGNLPSVQYTYDNNGKRCVDTINTEPESLSRLNGQYWDQAGNYHAPNADGYLGKTSGGLSEAVVNQLPNTPENISYTKIDGFKRNEGADLKTSSLSDGYSPNVIQQSPTSQNVASEGGGSQAPPNSTKVAPSREEIPNPPNPSPNKANEPIGPSKADITPPAPTKAQEQTALGPTSSTQITPESEAIKGADNLKPKTENNPALDAAKDAVAPKKGGLE